MKKTFKSINQLIALSATSILLTGCATIVGDNSRTIQVDSIPQGAGIYIDGQRYGTTPTAVLLPKYIYRGKTIVIKKEGYQDLVMVISTKFQPCSLFGIIVPFGILIDVATGHLVKIDPAHHHMTAELHPIASSTDKSNG